MKEWEKDVPLGIVAALDKAYRGRGETTTSAALKAVECEGCKVLTPLSRIREIARIYTRRYKIPVKVSEKFFEGDHKYADAVHTYGRGKSTIYLHPVLKYYPEKYIRGVIEHEIDHHRVERKWEKIL